MCGIDSGTQASPPHGARPLKQRFRNAQVRSPANCPKLRKMVPLAQPCGQFRKGPAVSLKIKLAAVVALVAIGVGIWVFPAAANWIAVVGDDRDLQLNITMERPDVVDPLLPITSSYNERLFQGLEAFANPYHDAEYLSALGADGDSEVARIVIPKIDVSLRVYPGTNGNSLDRGAGHLYGSSVPVGGPSTHAVISAHSGLVTARRFTDLHSLEVGDTFAIVTRGQQLHYRVDQIIVVPAGDEARELDIIADHDYATLLTCTPIGINTHRLLVRGERFFPTPEEIGPHYLTVSAGFPWWAAIWLAVTGTMTGGATWLNHWFNKQMKRGKAKGASTGPRPVEYVSDWPYIWSEMPEGWALPPRVCDGCPIIALVTSP